MKCWGLNSQAELGPFRKPDSAVPVEIPGVSDATAVSCGYARCCAVAAGAVKCWGDMASVVEPDAPAVKDPIAIGAVTGAASLAVDGHVCATAARKLLCWGDNQHGQVGGPKLDAGSRVREPTEVRGLRGVTRVATGRGHTCAIADGKAYCWGNFSVGQLGNGKRAADSMFDPSLNQPAPQLVKW